MHIYYLQCFWFEFHFQLQSLILALVGLALETKSCAYIFIALSVRWCSCLTRRVKCGDASNRLFPAQDVWNMSSSEPWLEMPFTSNKWRLMMWWAVPLTWRWPLHPRDDGTPVNDGVTEREHSETDLSTGREDTGICWFGWNLLNLSVSGGFTERASRF